MGTTMSLQAYGWPLETVAPFKFLGSLLTAIDNDWPEVIDNPQKARKSWARLSQILGREGADNQTSSRFYLALVQAVLIFGVDTWVVTPYIGRMMEGLYRRGVQRIWGQQLCIREDGTREYPPLEEAMRAVGLEDMDIYISRINNTVAQYIVSDLFWTIAWRRIRGRYSSSPRCDGSRRDWI